jgi:hypothetical protein
MLEFENLEDREVIRKLREQPDDPILVWAMYLSVCIGRMKHKIAPLSTEAKKYISRNILLRAYCEYNESMKATIFENYDSADETLEDDIEDVEVTIEACKNKPISQ